MPQLDYYAIIRDWYYCCDSIIQCYQQKSAVYNLFSFVAFHLLYLIEMFMYCSFRYNGDNHSFPDRERQEMVSAESYTIQGI